MNEYILGGLAAYLAMGVMTYIGTLASGINPPEFNWRSMLYEFGSGIAIITLWAIVLPLAWWVTYLDRKISQ